jgi:hypothetical protein
MSNGPASGMESDIIMVEAKVGTLSIIVWI